MVKTLRRFLVVTGVLGTVALLAVGCGRKADLDPPSMSATDQNKRGVKQPEKVDKPFILDRLL